MIHGIDHTALSVPDLKVAVRFYCDVLGFEVEPGHLALVRERYEALHPKLIVAAPHAYPTACGIVDRSGGMACDTTHTACRAH